MIPNNLNQLGFRHQDNKIEKFSKTVEKKL